MITLYARHLGTATKQGAYNKGIGIQNDELRVISEMTDGKN